MSTQKLNETKRIIRELVLKYNKSRSLYLTPHYNEAMLRSDFLDSLFKCLGWDINNEKGMSTCEREVLLEEPLRENALVHTKKPDYTFRQFNERKFFVEAKKPCVSIHQEDEPAQQVRRYGYSAGLRISVLSNFEHLFIYDTTIPVEPGDSRVKSLVKSYHYSEYEQAAEELLLLIGRESVYSGRFDEVWHTMEMPMERQSVDERFLWQINKWRLLLGHEVLLITPKIDIQELGDIVQSYLNKILFLRVCEDRNIETYQQLLLLAEHDDGNALIAKFREADKKYNSGLFDERLSQEVVCNIKSVFWTIIRQLYYPNSPYSFALLSSDILGKIYEIFVVQRFAVNGTELVLVNKPENQERDIVTTPTHIVREILNQTIMGRIKGKSLQEICNLSFADIACGSGAFLLELFQLLQDTIIDYYIEYDKTQLIQTGINSYKLPFATKKKILTHCIYGVDKDYNAVESCKLGLLLKLLEGENEQTLPLRHPILPSMDNNIHFGNSLLSPSEVPDELIEAVNPFDFNNMRFDFIIGNPPYMKTEDIKKFTPNEHKLYPKYYATAYKQYDKYFLFLERALYLLKPQGVAGYIVPSKFMKVGAATKLRELLAGKQCVRSITTFGAHQVFSDKSTYSCIVVVQKEPVDEFSYAEIDNYTQWRLRAPGATTVCHRKSAILGPNTWVLYSDKHKSLLEDKILNNSQSLEDIVGDDYIFNGIQTSANEIYVFSPTKEDARYYYFQAFNGQEYPIEKSVTKPYFRTTRGRDTLNSYKSFQPNARVIFPYKKNPQGHIELIPLVQMIRKYPKLYNYLMDAKVKLASPTRDIKPTPQSPDEWYRYGRQQSLDACEVKEKMIVGVLSQSEKYAVDNQGTLVSSGGTAGYCMICVPRDKKYSIYYIQALLGSAQGEWLASLYGEIFRGGFIARGTKVLKQMPLRTIDFDNPYEVCIHDDIVLRQKRLIGIGDKLTACAGNARKRTPLLRRFELLKEQQQQAINNLYGMSKDEQLLIPNIKQLYAAD